MKMCTNAISLLRMLHVLPPGRTTSSHEPPALPPGGTTAHMMAAFWTPALSSWLQITADNVRFSNVQCFPDLKLITVSLILQWRVQNLPGPFLNYIRHIYESAILKRTNPDRTSYRDEFMLPLRFLGDRTLEVAHIVHPTKTNSKHMTEKATQNKCTGTKLHLRQRIGYDHN